MACDANGSFYRPLHGCYWKSLMWKHFCVAVSFLTVFRLPSTAEQTAAPEDLAASFSWFPLVGFMLGLCMVAMANLCQGLPPSLLAVILTALLAIMTRGLHLDGLADLADGIGGGYTAERRLEIMKDSRTGAFGALALIFAILLKTTAIYTLVVGQCWTGMLLAPVLSRFSMVLGAYRMPYARCAGGLGKPFLEHMNSEQVLAAFLLSAIFLVLVSLKYGLLLLGLAIGCAALMRSLARRWLGGMTGDVLGALNEITEIVLLGASACCCAG
jgi:adenosylcobinamide-GDP ribazoletransferase